MKKQVFVWLLKIIWEMIFVSPLLLTSLWWVFKEIIKKITAAFWKSTFPGRWLLIWQTSEYMNK